MKVIRSIYCLFVMARVIACFSGEIVYQDYLAESELLTAQDQRVDAMVNVAFDWNYFFKSNSLAVALKIKYGYGQEDESNPAFRPVVVRYDFDGVHEPVGKSIRRADTCFRGIFPAGFCMVGLDSFLFSHEKRSAHSKTAFMCISDSAQSVVDITSDVNGMCLLGVLSASERAVFPNGEGFAFQCIGKTNDCNLLLWNKGVGTLWPVRSRLRGYTCLSGGRVLLDELDTSDVRTTYKYHSSPITAQDRQVASNLWESESREYWKINARCYQVLSCWWATGSDMVATVNYHSSGSL